MKAYRFPLLDLIGAGTQCAVLHKMHIEGVRSILAAQFRRSNNLTSGVILYLVMPTRYGGKTMAYTLTQAEMNILQGFASSGDRAGYYTFLANKGDGYALMALGVVNNDSIAGQVANAYARSVTSQFDPAMTDAQWSSKWLSISNGLMAADFALRQQRHVSSSSDYTLNYQEIQLYHNTVFTANGVPKEAWTAEIVLENHPNPQVWWAGQIAQGGINTVASYINLANEMAIINANEAANYRHLWYNSNGTVNDATANNPAWMLQHMPSTFWSQHIYSPSGMQAVLNGVFSSIPTGTNSILFDAGTLLSDFAAAVMSSANDILQKLMSPGLLHMASVFQDYAEQYFSTNSYWAGGHEFDHMYPIDGDFTGWGVNVQSYSDFSQKLWNIRSNLEVDTMPGQETIISYYDPKTNTTGLYITDSTEVTFELLNHATQWFMGLYDPIALDLDGDGIETISVANSQSSFLTEGDQNHGWLSADDGFLFFDRNNNGVADERVELFGADTIGGFRALRELDENGDLVIDQTDQNFSHLRIWRDLNGDGLSTEDEVFTLADYGISSLNLDNTLEYYEDNGNIVAEISSYERYDGTTHMMADVWFKA